jgi:molybdenum cofactor cytidylyltransferase
MVSPPTQFISSNPLNETTERHGDFSHLTVVLLLAAGLSVRMGQSKMLLPWSSGTLLDALVMRVLQETPHPLVVVCRPDLPLAIHNSRLHFVLNNSPERGISHSIQLAVSFMQAKWPGASAAILLGDEPFVLGTDIRRVIGDFDRRSANCHVVRPRYNQIPGHPVIFDCEALRWTGQLRGDRGFGALWAQHASAVCYVDYGVSGRPNPAKDIDTPEDYRTACRLAAEMER